MYPPESEHLFTIGYDIEIFKFDYKNKDFKKKCSEFALFKNENNEIIEEVKDNFYKRIQVIQMEEKKLN